MDYWCVFVFSYVKHKHRCFNPPILCFLSAYHLIVDLFHRFSNHLFFRTRTNPSFSHLSLEPTKNAQLKCIRSICPSPRIIPQQPWPISGKSTTFPLSPVLVSGTPICPDNVSRLHQFWIRTMRILTDVSGLFQAGSLLC